MRKNVTLYRDHRLAIISVDGVLSLEAFLKWIEHQPDARLFCGNDRIVVLGLTARAGDLTASKLQLMQGRCLSRSTCARRSRPGAR